MRPEFKNIDYDQLWESTVKMSQDVQTQKQIIRLCASAGWFEANIGLKCLKVLLWAFYLKNLENDNPPDSTDSKELMRYKKEKRKLLDRKKDILETILLVANNILAKFSAICQNNESKFSFKEEHTKLLQVMIEVFA
jgi:hypothetical protein